MGKTTHDMILCEVLIMGFVYSKPTLPPMFCPKSSSGYNLFPQAVIEDNVCLFF